MRGYDGLMHTLFALEDIYGFKITNIDGEICLSLKKFDNPSYPQLFDNFTAWHEQASNSKHLGNLRWTKFWWVLIQLFREVGNDNGICIISTFLFVVLQSFASFIC